MTANEMKDQLLILIDKIFQLAAPAYDETAISKILTEAQHRVITKDIPRFESSERVRANLEEFIKEATVSASSSQTGVHTNGTFYDMPTDFFLAVEERANTAAVTDIKVKPIKHDFYIINKSNPYKQPNIASTTEVYWRMDFSRETHAVGVSAATPKRVELITEGTAVTSYKIRYIVSPPDIVVDTITVSNQVHSILDENVHYEIVREAAKIIKGSTEPEGYEIASKEAQENKS